MKVTVVSPVTHGDTLHLEGEEITISQQAAEILIAQGVVKEVKASASRAETPSDAKEK